MAKAPLPPHSKDTSSPEMRDWLEEIRRDVDDLDAAGGDPDQNLWLTVTSDSGTTAASTTTDTLTVAGGTGISTAISSDTVTVSGTSASTTVAGMVELATVDETNTGTSTTLAVTPDGLDGWTGSTQIVTVGTITSGTWQGTAIAADQGGSGQTSYTNGQLLIGNTTGNTLTKATLTEGEGIDITNGAGSVTIAGENASTSNKGIASFNSGDFTVSSGAVSIQDSGIDHDATTNFVANEHIDWTSTSSNFNTTGTVDTGNLSVTGTISVTSTVDGRDIATDGTKLDGIEASADVTDETNVTDALDGATLTAATVASADKVLIQDADDSDILKTATAQSIADLGGGGGGGDPDQNLWETITGDTGSTTANTITDNLTIAGGTEITTAVSGDTLTINSDFTPSSTDTLTNKTFDANGTGNSLSNVDLTADITGTLPVANGGTGATSLTDGGILLGSGSGAITALGVATNGQIPIGDGATDPVLATLTAGDGINITNGSGSITIAKDGWELIQEDDMNGSTSSEITDIDSKYSSVIVMLDHVGDTTTSGGSIIIEQSSGTGGSPTYDTNGYFTTRRETLDATETISFASASNVLLTSNDASHEMHGNSGNAQPSGYAQFFIRSQSTRSPWFSKVYYQTEGAQQAFIETTGRQGSTAVINALRLTVQVVTPNRGYVKWFGLIGTQV